MCPLPCGHGFDGVVDRICHIVICHCVIVPNKNMRQSGLRMKFKTFWLSGTVFRDLKPRPYYKPLFLLYFLKKVLPKRTSFLARSQLNCIYAILQNWNLEIPTCSSKTSHCGIKARDSIFIARELPNIYNYVAWPVEYQRRHPQEAKSNIQLTRQKVEGSKQLIPTTNIFKGYKRRSHGIYIYICNHQFYNEVIQPKIYSNGCLRYYTLV